MRKRSEGVAKEPNRRFRRRKGAFDRYLSNQVYGDGSKVLGQEPVEDIPDQRDDPLMKNPESQWL